MDLDILKLGLSVQIWLYFEHVDVVCMQFKDTSWDVTISPLLTLPLPIGPW